MVLEPSARIRILNDDASAVKLDFRIPITRFDQSVVKYVLKNYWLYLIVTV